MRKPKKSIRDRVLPCIFLSVSAGLAVTSVLIVLFSVILCFLLKDMGLAGAFATASLIAGTFSGSYICGHFRRRHGILLGAVCGMVIFAVISVMGVIIAGHTPGIRKIVLLAVSGMTGGVYGVNSKHPL